MYEVNQRPNDSDSPSFRSFHVFLLRLNDTDEGPYGESGARDHADRARRLPLNRNRVARQLTRVSLASVWTSVLADQGNQSLQLLFPLLSSVSSATNPKQTSIHVIIEFV